MTDTSEKGEKGNVFLGKEGGKFFHFVPRKKDHTSPPMLEGERTTREHKNASLTPPKEERVSHFKSALGGGAARHPYHPASSQKGGPSRKKGTSFFRRGRGGSRFLSRAKRRKEKSEPLLMPFRRGLTALEESLTTFSPKQRIHFFGKGEGGEKGKLAGNGARKKSPLTERKMDLCS